MAVFHEHQHLPHSSIEQEHGQIVKIFSKADKTYNLAVRNDRVVMVPADSDDPSQIWIKDLSYGERTKDNFGCPAFVLVNKASGKALKHGKEKGHRVYLADYRHGMPDEDILFTESQDFGEGFRTVRMASDTLLNMSLMPEEEKSGLFHRAHKPEHPINEATPLVLDTWHEKDTQLWKIFSLCSATIRMRTGSPDVRSSKIVCKNSHKF